MGKVQIISREEAFEVQVGDSVFVLRRLTRDVLAESRRRHTRTVAPDEPGGTPRDEVDGEAVNDDIVDYVIQAWRGVSDHRGAEVDCTRENKLALPGTVLGELLGRSRALNMQGDLELDVKNLKPPSGA